MTMPKRPRSTTLSPTLSLMAVGIVFVGAAAGHSRPAVAGNAATGAASAAPSSSSSSTKTPGSVPPGTVGGAGGIAGSANVQGGAAAGATPAVNSEAATAKRLAALRKKVLKDQDFVENDEGNRDPFHSYARLFVDRSAPKTRKVPAIFDKVALDELTLIAIVSGDETPRAMFRDATGYGQAVKRGDFLSRAVARVTKILSDRVIVEITETSGTGETRVLEKAILVHPGEGP